MYARVVRVVYKLVRVDPCVQAAANVNAQSNHFLTNDAAALP